jgi:hypothetical protein
MNGNVSQLIIDFEKPPFVPKGLILLPDTEQLPKRVRGQVGFDPTEIGLYLDIRQRKCSLICGDRLREKLKDIPVCGVQYGDFLYANQHLIPEEWKRKRRSVFFWGTIYRDAVGDLCVRYLFWRRDEWHWGHHWLSDFWYSDAPTAVLPVRRSPVLTTKF